MSKDERTEDATGRRRTPKMLPMQDGEEVILVASPSKAANLHKYLYTLGLYGIWRKRDTAVVTSQRLLIGKGSSAGGVLDRDQRHRQRAVHAARGSTPTRRS